MVEVSSSGEAGEAVDGVDRNQGSPRADDAGGTSSEQFVRLPSISPSPSLEGRPSDRSDRNRSAEASGAVTPTARVGDPAEVVQQEAITPAEAYAQMIQKALSTLNRADHAAHQGNKMFSSRGLGLGSGVGRSEIERELLEGDGSGDGGGGRKGARGGAGGGSGAGAGAGAGGGSMVDSEMKRGSSSRMLRASLRTTRASGVADPPSSSERAKSMRTMRHTLTSLNSSTEPPTPSDWAKSLRSNFNGLSDTTSADAPVATGLIAAMTLDSSGHSADGGMSLAKRPPFLARDSMNSGSGMMPTT